MTSKAPQIHDKSVGEIRLLKVDFGDSAAGEKNRTGKLDSGELLTGTPIVVTQTKDPDTATDLTYGNIKVNTSTLPINGRDAIVGEAVQFTAAAGEDDATYIISVLCGTDADPPQTVETFTTLKIVEPS